MIRYVIYLKKIKQRGKTFKQPFNNGKNHKRNYTSQGFYSSESKQIAKVPHLSFSDPIYRAHQNKISSVRNSIKPTEIITCGQFSFKAGNFRLASFIFVFKLQNAIISYIKYLIFDELSIIYYLFFMIFRS